MERKMDLFRTYTRVNEYKGTVEANVYRSGIRTYINDSGNVSSEPLFIVEFDGQHTAPMGYEASMFVAKCRTGNYHV